MNNSSDSTVVESAALPETATDSSPSQTGPMESPNDTSPVSDSVLLFVYGTLKRDFGNNRLLQDSKYVADATITGVMRSLGGFPCVSLNGDYTVYGELFEVGPEVLAACDRLEGHPSWYVRTKVRTNKGDAWVYLIEDEKYTTYPIVKSGKWLGRTTEPN